MDARRTTLIATVLVALATSIGAVLVVSSWRRLSVTFDEPNHVGSGLEWLEKRTYRLWTENPPLARVAVAAIPYLAGARLGDATGSVWARGRVALERDDQPRRNLSQARAGTLLFYLATVVLTGLVAGRGQPLAGLIAAALVATLPAVIAHSSLATTDMGFVAMFLLAVFALQRWLERRTLARAALFGAAAGLALLTKFTAILFLPPVTALVALGHWRAHPWPLRALPRHLGLALVTFALVVWAGYWFSYGPVADPRMLARASFYVVLRPPAERTGIEALLGGLTLPAPELFHGLLHLRAHNAAGHPTYLFGQLGQTGFAAFYPVALLVKTPLPFLLLALAGAVVLMRNARTRAGQLDLAPLVAAVVIVLALLPSRINIGVRHALVVYPFLAWAAARGLMRLANGPRRRQLALAVPALLAAQLGIAIAAHPDQLSYFNPIAGREPGRVLLDSDLDWGQGLLRLGDEARARKVDRLKIAMRISMGDTCHPSLGLPPLEPLLPHQPTTGWIAVTENLYWGRTESWTLRDPCHPLQPWGESAARPPGWFRWLHAHTPVWRGAGMRLYFIP